MMQIQDLILSKEMQLRALAEPEEDAEQILQSLCNLKTNKETEKECFWDVFTEEILPRLPANQLQTLKTVCKNWLQIIPSPYFIRLHLNIYNQSQIRILVQWWNSEMMIEYKYNKYCDEETKLQIHHPPAMIRKRPPNYILGSCDGLLCLLLQNDTIAVYNPSTGKYLKVQFAREFGNINICWFGQYSGEYVLVLGNFNREIRIYKFSGSSNVLGLIQSTCCCRSGLIYVVDRGEARALHRPASWHSQHHGVPNTRYIICAYRLQDNKHLEISPPVQCSRFKLGVAEGCLFAILKPSRNAEFEMWIMKEYGVQQSWIKYANIHGFNGYGVLSPLGFFPNGDLILDAGNIELIKYSFNDDKAVLLMNRDSTGCEAILCAHSLVSPTIVYS